MAEIEVREVRSEEYRTWDELVTGSPQGTVFHLSDWAVTCASLSHKRPLLLGYYEDGCLTGGCLLYVTTKFRVISTAASTAPMTPYGGYLLPESVSTKVREREIRNRSIVQAISDEISKQGFASANIRNSPAFQDIRPLTWDGWTSSVYYTYELPLVEDISSHISKKLHDALWATSIPY